MSLSSYKITDSAISSKGVVAAPDRLSGTAAQNKAIFDRLIRESVKDLYNGLIDLLSSSAASDPGAGNIGAAAINGLVNAGGSVQGALQGLKSLVDACETQAAASAALALKEDKSVSANHFKAVSFNENTGVFTFTREGGGTVAIDTLLEKVAVNFAYDSSTQSLILTLKDGSTQTVSLSDFITELEFLDSDQIEFSVSGHQVTATVKSGSITDTMLSSALISALEEYVSTAGYWAEVATMAAGDAASAKNAAVSARDAAAASAGSAQTSAAAADSAKNTAVDARTDALDAAEQAEDSKESAETAAGYAIRAKTDAESAETAAEVSKNAAVSAKNMAMSAKNDAADSASDAEAYAAGTRGGEPVSSSDPAYENNAKYYADAAEEAAATLTVDDEMSGSSTNPVQNKVITAALEAKLDADEFPAAFPTEAASGAVVSVTDGADGLPVRSLKVRIAPAQSGSGVPAPDNLRNISGRTGASVFRAGRNMFDEATAVLYDRFINVSATPKLWSYDASSKSIAFPCKPNTAYSVSCSDPDAETVITVFRVGWIESGIPSGIGTAPEVHGVFNVGAAGSVTLTTGEYATHIVVQLNAAILSARSARLQIEPGSATPYEAYRGAACVFDWESEAGTVYGGTLDVTTGVLTADRGLKVFTGQESGWEKFTNDNPNGTYFGLAGTTAYAAFADDPEAICSINKRSSAANFASGDGFYWTSGGWRILYGAAHAGESLEDFKAYVQQKYAAGTPVAVCAKLASPQAYQLTPAEVKTLLAENTLWADCGDVIELIFRADPTLFVNEKLAAARRLTELMITAERTDTMTAPHNLTAGQLIVARGTLYKAAENIASGAELVPNSNITETTVAAELAALA